MRTIQQQLEHDAARVRAELKPSRLGWSTESIYRLLFTLPADAAPYSTDDLDKIFQWIADIQDELRRTVNPAALLQR